MVGEFVVKEEIVFEEEQPEKQKDDRKNVASYKTKLKRDITALLLLFITRRRFSYLYYSLGEASSLIMEYLIRGNLSLLFILYNGNNMLTAVVLILDKILGTS